MKQRIQVNIRLTEEEQKLLQAKSEKHGMNVSAYIRQCALKEETRCIYNPAIRKAIEYICALYPIINEMQISEEMKWKYTQGVSLLWQNLK